MSFDVRGMGVTMEHQQYVLLGDLVEEWQEVGLVVMGGGREEGEGQEREGEGNGQEAKEEGEGKEVDSLQPPPAPTRSTPPPPPPQGFFPLLSSPFLYSNFTPKTNKQTNKQTIRNSVCNFTPFFYHHLKPL